jgi:Signal transduction histidine kinase regulating C4-dicarboxylate transport system
MKDDEIRILILEDNPTDAELAERELRKGGIVFQSKRVETREDFISQIEEFRPQVILADYKLPAFTGMEAFSIIKKKDLEVPFIIVSGTLGEDLAIETLKTGVTDYVLKSNLNRLVPAVNRALAETKMLTERKEQERRQALVNRILNELNSPNEVTNLVRRILIVLKSFIEIEAVGIRLREGEDYPYYETNGFPKHFVEAERYLCARDENNEIVRDKNGNPYLECMCGNIICGRPDPSLPFFTKGGSFWTNSTSELLASTSEKDRQGRTRNRCNGEGYESVALIPLRSGEDIIGLLQLNDKQPGRFTLDMIQFLEGIGLSIGIAVFRTKTEVELKKNEQRTNALLNIFRVTETSEDEVIGMANEDIVKLTESGLALIGLIDKDEKTMYGHLWSRMAMEQCTIEKKPMEFPIESAGIWAEAIRQHKVFMVNDYSEPHPEKKGLPKGHVAINSFLSVPMLRNGRVLMIGAVANKKAPYTDDDSLQISLFLEGLWERISILRSEEALRRSEEETKRLAHENGIIAEIGRIISSTLDIEKVYDRFSEEVKKLISFDRIRISTFDLKHQMVVTLAYVSGHDIPDRRQGDHIPLAGSVDEELIKRRSSILFQTDKEEEWAERFPALVSSFQSGIRSILAVPLLSKDQVIGVLHLQSLTPKAYTEADLQLAEKVGNQIAGAIANAQLFDDHERSEAEKANLQSQLQQSQKMEAIGRLAGGVAHDFNNLLTVISIQSQLSVLGLREGDPLRENLKEIEKAADRAADLTRQLLAFSRRQILEMKVVNLNFIVNDLEKMLRRVIGEDIELKTILADDLGMVKVDPGQMEQVIVNLAVNAKDAMPQGGQLAIETTNVELDGGYTRTHMGVVPGAYVMLSISDTGVGMTREIKERIFDPFFTTKEKGKGTGLGLSTVYGIVKQSGGDIYVYSEPNQGTAFKIYFPRVFEPGEEWAKKEAGGEVSRGKETILVVEDDGMVRKLAVNILRGQGYTVLEAEAGGEALLMCEQYKEPIDLILTDVVMPHMSGPEFIERLRQVRKNFKALYMSGYTDETIVQQGILEKGIELIHKPFTIEKLARKVREVLDKN